MGWSHQRRVVVMPGDALQPVPADVALDIAAAAQVTGLTAWVALARLGRLQPGETLLVHGARGGVGQACVQIGLHLGARLIATATDPACLQPRVDLGVLVLPARGLLPQPFLMALKCVACRARCKRWPGANSSRP